MYHNSYSFSLYSKRYLLFVLVSSAWIEESQIKPYEAFKEQFSKAAKTTLKEAIDAIEDYINNKGEVT